MKRPRFIGEDFFATGINPADYAIWGGEGTFAGKAQTRPAAGLIYRMLTEGYRWVGQSAWHFWLDQSNTAGNPYNSQLPRAVFVRQWDWSFGSGQKIKRTFGIFNDTQYNAPLTFTRTLLLNNKVAWTKKSQHKIAPGTSEKFDETIPLPNVTKRSEAQLIVKLEAEGKEIFRDSKAVSILAGNVGAQSIAPGLKPIVNRAQPVAGRIALFDPSNKIAPFLKAQRVQFTALNSLENLPQNIKVLIVGPDALSVEESTSSRLAAFASTGKTVLVLEQKNPLKYQGLPAEMEPSAENSNGSIGFIEDENHPAFTGLRQKDFFVWGADEGLYRGIYNKPTRGAKSLIQAGPRLSQSALVEVTVGSGLMLLSQLQIGEKLGSNIVARQLLQNLLSYAASYRQEFRPVAVASDNAQLLKAVDAIGLQYQKTDALVALGNQNIKLLLVSATPQALKNLVANQQKVNAFMARGGYIVFHGLTPEGLADYNKLVGFDHMIRPFKRERVTFPNVRSPLTAGLTLGDIVMLSGERIFGWTADEYVANDAFSYVVDYEDVAPFAKSSSFLFDNATNNFFQADAWKLINNFDAPKEGTADIPMEFPKAVSIKEFTWVGNTLYAPQTRVNLVFNDKEKVSFKTEPNAEPQTFGVEPPRSGKKVTLQIAEWQAIPEKMQNGKVVIGIDNFYLKAARPDDFYQKVKPLLNIGGLLHYPRAGNPLGGGGMLLCNLNFKDTEAVPVNATKKRTILAALLRNLKAPFAGKTIIAGANLQYAPIDIGKQANQFRNERGWFGDKNFTFAGLPTGKQTFAGVQFEVYDFPTSPVPNAIMLGGNGVPNNLAQSVKGIPVNRKADALFFLQSARIDNRMNNDDRQKNRKFEMARYVIRYADGTQETVPLYSEIDVETYRQKTPTAIPGAQIGWTKPYENGEYAVAYVKQWTNPKPGVEIQSFDLEYGPEKRGVPVLLAVTAASAAK
jgi:beta-galactosidase